MIYWSEDRKLVEKEFIRMGFDKDSRWRISDINKDFELCNTYPRFFIVPSSFKDEDLESVAKFRYFRRVPSAVWRHCRNGCFIVRSSQPTVGWFGWFRNDLDESLVQRYINNTMPPDSNDDDTNTNEFVENFDDQCDQRTIVDGDIGNVDELETPEQQSLTSNPNEDQQLEENLNDDHNNYNNNLHDAAKVLIDSSDNTDMLDSSSTFKNELDSESLSPKKFPQDSSCQNGNGLDHPDNNIPTATVTETEETTSKMLIIDARSYTAAMANRAKGGGCECSEYYLRCEVQFMNLANIHSIRKSFQSIRSVCEAYSEQSNNWVSFLDNSRWLHHISGLLKSALLVVDTIDIEEKSILIHCSDGWDRTPQLVALAEIMLDSYYRTFEGFRTLIQREWLDFGHKYADRCGSNPCNEDPNERCPVFLQWLDCVQQLLVQYPTHFEYNSIYLDKLNRHTYSNVFGTFSYNSTQERILSRVDDKLFSLWAYFDSSRQRFTNEKYIESDEILRPSYKVRDLHFWKEVYLPPLRNQAHYMPIANNIDNKKFYDLFYVDSLTRTVCK